MKKLFVSNRGQATTETVLLFPILVIFIIFIIKIFGLLVLTQKMEIAGFYAARRYQLQSHTTEFLQRWDRNFLKKDIQRKVEDYLGFNNRGMKRLLSLRSLKLNINTSGTWIKIKMTVRTAPPRINFLCKYNKYKLCEDNQSCYVGYAYLCETGGEIEVIKYVGPNERVLPWVRPENH